MSWPFGSQAIFILPFLDKIIFLLTAGVERMQGLNLCVQWGGGGLWDGIGRQIKK